MIILLIIIYCMIYDYLFIYLLCSGVPLSDFLLYDLYLLYLSSDYLLYLLFCMQVECEIWSPISDYFGMIICFDQIIKSYSTNYSIL